MFGLAHLLSAALSFAVQAAFALIVVAGVTVVARWAGIKGRKLWIAAGLGLAVSQVPRAVYEWNLWRGDRYFAQFVAWLSEYVHVIWRFDQIAQSRDRTDLYLALTTCLAPLKVLFFFLWLNTDRVATYLNMVVSPLTEQRPTVSDFVLAGDHERRAEIERRMNSGTPRPLLERIAWSFAILGFAALTVFDTWYLFGYEIPKGGTSDLLSVRTKYAAIAEGGFSMWFWWAFVQLNVVAFVLAAAVCVLRDYAVWFGQLVAGRNSP